MASVQLAVEPRSESLLAEARGMTLEEALDADGKLVRLADTGRLGHFAEWVAYDPARGRAPKGRDDAEVALRQRAATTLRAAVLAGLSFRVRWSGAYDFPDPEGLARSCLRSDLILDHLG